jgi:hypothetical protein
MAAPTPTVVMLLLVPLLVWRTYSRVRRLIGRQRLTRVRPWVSLTVMPLLAGLLCWLVYPAVEKIGWLAAGVTLGAALSRLGLRLTAFERTPQGLFYTPNRYLGLTLVLLFVGRIIYRVIEITLLSAGNTLTGFVFSSLTLAVFGLLAGYYVGYNAGLLRWRYKS